MKNDAPGQRLKKIIASAVLLLAVFLAAWGIFAGSGTRAAAGNLDGFAQCLTQKGFTMYGAYWCPHCQREKRAFGDSFRYVSYVECTETPEACTAESIRGYPTWLGPGGFRREGEQGIEELSKASGCPTEERGPAPEGLPDNQ